MSAAALKRLQRENNELHAEVKRLRKMTGQDEQCSYRIALRLDHKGLLDDVVVTGVSMFRMEDMGDYWWVCCYLEDIDDRICWSIPHRAVRKKGQWAEATELPDVVYEPGSMLS